MAPGWGWSILTSSHSCWRHVRTPAALSRWLAGTLPSLLNLCSSWMWGGHILPAWTLTFEPLLSVCFFLFTCLDIALMRSPGPPVVQSILQIYIFQYSSLTTVSCDLKTSLHQINLHYFNFVLPSVILFEYFISNSSLYVCCCLYHRAHFSELSFCYLCLILYIRFDF